jgi:hypothetical protein
MTIQELSEKSDEELRVMCAGLCGWTKLNPNTWEHIGSRMSVWPYSSVPSYPTDLNAMHEAEMTLTDEQHRLYRKLLFIGHYNRGEGQTNDTADRAMVSAPARQRCIAFIFVKQSS